MFYSLSAGVAIAVGIVRSIPRKGGAFAHAVAFYAISGGAFGVTVFLAANILRVPLFPEGPPPLLFFGAA